MAESLDVVILAAGKGTRMRSRRPKVLHPLAGLPLLEYSIRAALALAPARTVVVVGFGGDEVRAAFSGRPLQFVDQGDPRGTGHALLVAKPALSARRTLVLPGDVPLVPPAALRALLSYHAEAGAELSFLTMEPPDPRAYGRVVREDGRPVRIVEAQDATADERAIREVNSGIYCLTNTPHLWQALAGLSTDNAKAEYYLTDLVAVFARRGKAAALLWPHAEDLMGINDRVDLARAEAALRTRLLTALMQAGVTVVDPATVYISPDATVGPDTVLHPGTHLLGHTAIGGGCAIGPGAYLVDTEVEAGARVWYSVLEGAYVGPAAQIGPYAHLRPGARIGAGARVGNFVEVKAAFIGEGAKVSHLAYIGDAEVGAGANIGAGTITCNLQPGRKEKQRTEIGPGAFIGSNAALVAPVRIGEGAVVGAGSVITEDVPPYALAVERSPQVVKPGWAKERGEQG
ncbi:bifunctional UDP-N-acetylglucosamine diphosphorylase/glucosamine-1-phosphate N-acetyltransferase GlmU [Candidatus Bipolaricaulota bacterium]|nr:bifunctional UDP-N-acetylglucosamine diphosphorylase/glucosamine-1-phosphate N-acetyltransferase GlmU [Candidatus Bipolaricaulota bacterium]